jgi:choline-sulfatase
MKDHISISRRNFLKTAAAGTAMLGSAKGRPSTASGARPNILFITCDQLGLHALSAHGETSLHTPNIDRLIERGTTFMESNSTNPVCSPARSSLYTGLMPVETGVVSNNRGIAPGIPTSGEWLRKAGYETVYCGKWHMWKNYMVEDSDLLGFKVLPTGPTQGDLEDSNVSRSCEAWLRNYKGDKPFFLAANFLQPHDICFWGISRANDEGSLIKTNVPFERYGERLGLPELPPNNKIRPREPEHLHQYGKDYNDQEWQYYLYIYNRMTEMLDAEVGRLVDTLEETGLAENTMVVFTADHGDGNGRHRMVQKWYPYEESVKVPLIVSWPEQLKQGQVDKDHLVLGTDVVPTLCDFAGCDVPPNAKGLSLRPILEGKKPREWRDFLVTEHHIHGRAVRSKDFKYVKYRGDPVEMLFDMRNDPWETKNLYDDPKYADVMREHRRMLKQWNESMLKTPASPVITQGSPEKVRADWAKRRRAAAL